MSPEAPDPLPVSDVLDHPSDAEIEDAIVAALVRMASQGSVPAANAAIKLLAQRRQASASEAHRARLAAIRETPIALCRYMAELGQTPEAIEETLGRPLTDPERAACDEGKKARRIEMRAIELARARSGGPIERWMVR